MLRLLNDQGVGVDECDLYEPAASCGLILVTGITGSHMNIVAEAIAGVAPHVVEWRARINAEKVLGVKVGPSRAGDPTTFFMGELNPFDADHDENLTTVLRMLEQGDQVVTSVHANPVQAVGGLELAGLIARLGVDFLDDRQLSPRKTRLIDCLIKRRVKLIGVRRGAGVAIHVHTTTLSEFVDRNSASSA
jgi:hypothetical protein